MDKKKYYSAPDTKVLYPCCEKLYCASNLRDMSEESLFEEEIN